MKLTVPVVRDLVMLGLGSGGMVHELFMVPSPDPLRVTVSMLLLLGSATVNLAWFARNTPPTPTGPTGGPPVTGPAPPSSLPSSSSPSS